MMCFDRKKTSPKIRALSKRLRKNQTRPERLLWKVLRNRQVNRLKWRRQHPIGNFIVDFYCAEYRLVLELDGDSHADRINYDEQRTKWLVTRGYHVIRFANREIVKIISGIIDQIIDVVDELAG